MFCYQNDPENSAKMFASNINKLLKSKSRKNCVEDWAEAFKTSPVFTAYSILYTKDELKDELLRNLKKHSLA